MLPILLVILCVVFRIVPHPPNFAPVGAAAVFAGRTLKPWMALSLTGLAMFAGDFMLSRIHGYAWYSGVTPFVYAGFFVQAMLGRGWRARRGGAIGAAFAGSIVFFVISNFGVWATSGMYAHNPAGALACYAAAIPFFGGTLVGNVVWTVILSALYKAIAPRFEPRQLWVPVPTSEMATV